MATQRHSLFRKILHFPTTKIIVGFAVCIILPVTIKEFLVKPSLESIIHVPVYAKFIQHLVSLVTIFGAYYLLFKYYEKEGVPEFALPHLPKEAAAGVGMGFVCITLVIGMLFLLGTYRIVAVESFDVFFLPMMTLFLLAFTEEIIYRGILYRILEKSIGTWLALLMLSLLFGAAHIMNPNANAVTVASATLGGLLLGMLYSYSRRLWLPIFFHFSWNFSQVFYGSNVTGMDDFGRFLFSEISGPTIITGGAGGVENSIFTFVICSALFVLYCHKTRIKGHLLKPFWSR